MVKPISDYTESELIEKIDSIKAEREKTYNALKRYEEELERRKQEVPMGVPLPDKDGAPFVGVYELGFPSEKSFFTFSKRFQNYVTATRDNAKGEQIDIKVLLPLLPKGWVLMNECSHWFWCEEKPEIINNNWTTGWRWNCLTPFNIKPVEDWKNSLMECGL